MKETQRQCKVKDCTGNIVATGEVWPMANNRYFHKCNKCGFETTVTGKMFGIHGVFTFPEMGKKIEKARARIEKSNSKNLTRFMDNLKQIVEAWKRGKR